MHRPCFGLATLVSIHHTLFFNTLDDLVVSVDLSPSPSPCARAQDLRELAERGTASRERLVLSHVRLVMFLASKRGRRTALSSMDLIQVCASAVCLESRSFDLPPANNGRGQRRRVVILSDSLFGLGLALEEALLGSYRHTIV